MIILVEVDYIRIINTLINYALLIAILFGIYKAIKGFKSFLLRNNEMEKKIDTILSRLDKKEDDIDKL